MNHLNFNQSGGFPLETDILDEMQKAYRLFNALGSIVGDLSIISGCIVTGTAAAAGVVFINGELLEFRGGVVQANVIIVEEKQLREFEDGNSNDVIFIRYATFGVGTTQWPWASFKRGFETKGMLAALDKKEDKTTTDSLLERIEALENQSTVGVPKGLIALWGRPANEIPAGWKEYTLLRGRMAVGYDSSDPLFDTMSNYGGSKTKQLSIDELPKFTPTGTAAGPYTGTDIGGGFDGGGNTFKERPVTMKEIGGDKSFSIMNPYRVVLYIEKQ